MAIELFKHNQEAYESAVAMLDAVGKACVIHPTGTGKSFIGFRYAVDHPETKVLWLAPSEYIFRTQMENWLHAGGEELPNITFLTYAKLSIMSEEDLSQFNISHLPFTIVLDEFHRAGAAQWGLGVDRLISTVPNAEIIG